VLPRLDRHTARGQLRLFTHILLLEFVLLGPLRPRTGDARSNTFHLIFALQFHLLELDFFQEVFGIEVGRVGDFLQFFFVFVVLFY